MNRIDQAMFVVLISFLLVLGCATEQRIPADDIRERADRSFDELRAEKRGAKAVPREPRRQPTKPSVQSEKVRAEAVAVQKGKRPDWVHGESIQYPSAQYLTGVGYDSDRKTAEDKARAEIAKIFMSRIDQQTKSYEEYLQTTSKGKSRTEEALSIEEITKVSTQKVLSGVRVAKVYQESAPDSLFYALAVLDRDQSAEILKDKVNDLDREVERLVSRAAAERDMLAKIKLLTQSLEKFVLREAHDAELRIVSRSGRGITSPVRFTQIKSELESILFRDFLIGVSVTGSRAGEIRDALLQGLNQQGFSISDNLSNAQVIVRGTVEIEPLDRGPSEWKYVQWRTHFDMIDKKGGAVFGSVDKAGREGHLNIPQAENRAVRKMREALTTEIAREMRRYIFSE